MSRLAVIRYHLFGPTMDAVTQLEQTCLPGCVHLSESFAVALRPSDPRWRIAYETDVASVNRLGIKRHISRLSRKMLRRTTSMVSQSDQDVQQADSNWGETGTSFRGDWGDDARKDQQRQAIHEAAWDSMFDLVSASDLVLAGA